MSPHSYTVHALMRDLRAGKFTSVGSYPTYFVTADGEALSHEAVRENLWLVARATRERAKWGAFHHEDSQWAVICAEVNWEDADLCCAHTGKPIECAYPSNPETESTT